MDLALTVHNQVTAVCPIFSVAIVDKNINATWRIDFDPIATPEEQTAAQAVVDTFDVAAFEAVQIAKAARADAIRAFINADPLTAELRNSSIAEIQAYIDANATGIPEIKTMLAKLALLIAYREL